MATKRATKGGEFGANGEWYEGGKFINTVAENQKREGSKPTRKIAKQMIAPYTWAFPPVGQPNARSIFRIISGNCARLVTTHEFVAAYTEQILNYMGMTAVEADDLIARYNAGERWI